MSTDTTTGPVLAAAEGLLDRALLDAPAVLVARADATPPPAGEPRLERPVRLVLQAAALVAITEGSVHAAARFTQERPIPRPLPGVDAATADPFSQTLLGAGLVEAQGARALVLVAARELDAAVGSAERATIDAVAARALSAFDVASRAALAQGERVWEVVGTSGARRALGFGDAGTVAREVALRHPRAARRREVAPSYLAYVAGRIDAVAA